MRASSPAAARLPALLSLGSLAATGVIALRTWLSPRLAWDRLPDGLSGHLPRVFVLDAALRSGDLYPRWLPDLYFGYGYPLFNFYAPGLYYLAAALHRAGATIYASLAWIGALALIFGAGGTLLLTRRLTGGWLAPTIAALCFVAAPYPFLTNLYVRGALPEAFALGLLPWLLLTGDLALLRGGAWILALAFAVATIVLVHNLTSLIAIALLAGWVAVRARTADPSRPGARTWRKFTIRGGVPLVAGLALTAWFWLPALLETRYVQINLAQGGLYDFHQWLFDPLKPVPAPYPHNALGPADLHPVFDFSAIGATRPEKPSLGQLLAWLLGAALLGLHVARPRRLGGLAAPTLLCLAVATGCWFLNTTWSTWLWEHVAPLDLVQFPWRFYGPMSLCPALGLGIALALPVPKRLPGSLVRAAGIGVVALLAYGSLAAYPKPIGKAPPHDYDERNLSALEKDRYAAATTSGGEFLPRTVGWPEYPDGTKAGIRLYDRAYPEASWQAGLVRIISGSAAVTGVYQQPRWIAADIEAAQDATVGFHQLTFPGWRAYVDGREVPIAPATVPLVDPRTGSVAGTASLGFITVSVPQGTHRVEVRFGATRARLAGDAISTAAATAALFWLLTLWLGRSARAVAMSPRRQVVLAATVGVAAAVLAAAWLTQQAGSDPVAPPGAERVSLDVIRALSGSAPPHYASVGGEARRTLPVGAAATLAVPLHVPSHAFLQLGIAPTMADGVPPQGTLRLSAVAAEGAARTAVIDRTVDVAQWSRDPTWVDVWGDMEFLAGKDVTLTLVVETAGAGAATDAPAVTGVLLANPQIVRWTNLARPYPGTQHLW